MKAYLILASILFSFTQLNAQCNGAVSLCSKSYNEVAYLTTHNAFNSTEDNFILPNQNLNITTQLNDGVRALMIDVYDVNGIATVYHGISVLGSEPLITFLDEIKTFLDNNPDEIVSIIFEMHTTADAIEDNLNQSNLFSFLYTHDGTWPTLQSMIDSGTRLVVFSEDDNGDSTQLWYHYIWDYAVETHFSANSQSDFSCDYNRGNASNDLFIFNHFITSDVGTGLENESIIANSNPYFIDRVLECSQVNNKFPNFIAIDFYEKGDGLNVVNQLNEVPLISSIKNVNSSNLTIYPNPSINSIEVTGLRKIEVYKIYNLLGKKVASGKLTDNQKIDIQNLTNGVYFIEIGNVATLKFIKK